MIWVWVAIAVAIIGVYWLFKSGKLRRAKLPRVLPPLKAGTEIAILRKRARQEDARSEELKAILDAKRELERARKKRSRLQGMIDEVGSTPKPKPTKDVKRL